MMIRNEVEQPDKHLFGFACSGNDASPYVPLFDKARTTTVDEKVAFPETVRSCASMPITE
jgi:hypothetical protein